MEGFTPCEQHVSEKILWCLYIVIQALHFGLHATLIIQALRGHLVPYRATKQTLSLHIGDFIIVLFISMVIILLLMHNVRLCIFVEYDVTAGDIGENLWTAILLLIQKSIVAVISKLSIGECTLFLFGLALEDGTVKWQRRLLCSASTFQVLKFFLAHLARTDLHHYLGSVRQVG